ncbi:MAG: sugar phosphate isomerase/epimerase family protein [Bacteroidota bacterium]
MTTRRTFLKSSATLSAGLLATGALFSSPTNTRKFSISIKAGNIGVQLPLPALIDKASAFGFEAISPDGKELVNLEPGEMQDLIGKMRTKNMKWGAGGVGVQFRKDEESFKKGLQKLPAVAKAYQQAGVQRIGTWIMPTHPELSYVPNFQQHVERLSQIAQILDDHDLQLGLEYVAPKTLMAKSRYPFMRTLAELRTLIAEIRPANVGVILDAFHWYCAEDTVEDLLSLSNSDVVAVDLNDATAGRSRDEQIDGQRQLPLASGIIDLTAFMSAIVKIGYDGPVRAEPFNQPLRDMKDEQALKATYAAMKKAVDLVE